MTNQKNNISSQKSSQSVYGLSYEDLEDFVKGCNQPAFRARQVWKWLYDGGVFDFEQMNNVPKKLRHRLQEHFVFGVMSKATEQCSKDGTVKRVYRLNDGQLIESVLMPYRDGRRTACISSQAGCAMRCVFCATGQMGFSRQLKAHEIFEQALRFANELKEKEERLSNIVYMGMGEPFHNYDAVVNSIKMLMDRLGIGARRITVSTVGLAPKIKKFAHEQLQVGLAISLHSTVNADRTAMMPINRAHPIERLVDACRYYVDKTNRRITFEWALIAGENDSVEEATRLGKLLKGIPCHVNLIPLNPTRGYSGRPTQVNQAQRFVQVLGQYQIPATIRVRRGIDIDAGCGQLKSKVQEKEKILPLQSRTEQAQ